ncbi:MAG TPA: rhodanese-like domain-containing protein [Coriobacteriia bacterium]|nr:rhodanese-like domain-containing protein [Coriobacteriia bacterium]
MFGWGVKKVSVDELAAKLAEGKQILVDVREPYEFAAGHVKGAVNVPLGTLASKLDRYDRHAEIFIMCHSGSRSASAASLMKKHGFENAYSVSGGTAAWRGKLVR